MSDILTRKLKTYFKRHDLNNDGYISLKEFVEMSERHNDATKASAAQREKTKALFTKVWRQWMKSSGSDDNGLLTAPILVESVKQQRNDPDFKATYLEISHNFFSLLDVDGDGFLQESDYARSFSGIGIEGASIARRAFASMDVKGEGKLSLDTFCGALLEYMISDDEKSPYSLLWGPLVE